MIRVDDGCHWLYAAVDLQANEHPHVRLFQSCTTQLTDDTWGERVKACVVLDEEATLSEDDVVDYVAERLADYKKSREVEFYESLPRNSTGKVIKEQLR